MGRILAIDYGKKRTGIAVSDPLKLIAGGLTTVATAELMKFLQTYVQKETVDQIVVGLPTTVAGTPSENQARVRSFVGKLRKIMPQIPVIFYDERFTSAIAHQTMLMGGMKKKDRQNKAKVDEISATIILQSYMESIKTI